MIKNTGNDSNCMIDENWLLETINNVVVDEGGLWRSKLFHEIVSAFKNKADTKTVFTVGSDDTEDSENNDKVATEDDSGKADLQESSKSFEIAKDIAGSDDKSTSSLVRNLKAGVALYDFEALNDRELMQLMNFGHLKQRDLEKKLNNNLFRAVFLRRMYFTETANLPLQNLPFQQYDYSFVNGSCCENVIGYVPVPTGIVGPLLVNGRKCFVPMSTTEGALIASTSRGCRAVFESGGIMARVYKDGMTRSPVVQFGSAVHALEMKALLDSPNFFTEIKNEFDSTSNYAKLQRLEVEVSGRLLFLRFEATTGDAMGMNMVSKGVNTVLSYLKRKHPKMEILSLSGNYCVDKKASAVNWIKGRGKSVVAEATIPATVVQTVLKTTVDAMVRLGQAKLMTGSSMACTIGGWNAHAANIVAAIFVATGQDVAQVVSSSMCLTMLEKTDTGDLYCSCNMRCLEVGTVGGGTLLPAQKACLQILGCGTPTSVPGECSTRLAEIICSTVLAGELSLMAAQCSNDLVQSHIRLNRSTRCLSKSAECTPAIQYEVNKIGDHNDERNDLKIALELPRRTMTEKPVKFEMHCSNIL